MQAAADGAALGGGFEAGAVLVVRRQGHGDFHFEAGNAAGKPGGHVLNDARV